MKISDNSIVRLAYFYIGFPYLIFLFGWLHWYISLPVAILFLVSIYFSISIYQPDNKIVEQIFNKPKVLLWVLFIIIIFILFSGIGGYSFQNEDHRYRNAIFHDLVNNSWPVLYQIKGFAADNPLEGKQTFLVYYLGFWLPAAIVAKVFGVKVGAFFLYTWAVLGVSLVFYFLCKYFKRFSIKILWIFIAWGTLYFLGSFYTFPIKDLLKGNAYLWAGNLLFADGNTGLIYWTFNQTIGSWLIILLIMNQLNAKNILFLTSLLFFSAPFAFIGFLPFVGYFIFKNDLTKIANFKCLISTLEKYSTFQNIIGSLSVIVIPMLYFSSNSSGNVFHLTIPPISTYFVFIFLSVGIIFMLIFDRFKTNFLYYLVLGILLALPFFQLGFGLDFVARVSIPAMLILMLLVGDYLIKSEKGWRRNAVIAYLIIAGLGHNLQFVRSVYFTGLQIVSNTNLGESLSKNDIGFVKNIGERLKIVKGKNITIQNDLVTLNNPINVLVRNFMGVTNTSVFYKYLAKTDGKATK
jgi:hypothetical protein